MKLTNRLKLAVLLGVLAAVPAALYLGGVRAAAQTPVKPSAPQGQTQTPKTPTPAAPAVTYSYVAQPGDSYTHMARKAVQTYGKKFNIKLTRAQIIYVETNLMQKAGAPSLEIGQKVDVAEATVKQWVDSAQALTPAQEAAWAYYVQFVDFNTDAVGVAAKPTA